MSVNTDGSFADDSKEDSEDNNVLAGLNRSPSTRIYKDTNNSKYPGKNKQDSVDSSGGSDGVGIYGMGLDSRNQ